MSDLIGKAKIGKCLVLLPYTPERAVLYENVIRPAIEKHMAAIRLDQLPSSDAIYTTFADAIRSASGIVADVTRLNENVMYEIGYAHGLGLRPLLYTEDPARLDQLPVYFRTLNVRKACAAQPVARLIDEYLTQIKAGRQLRLP